MLLTRYRLSIAFVRNTSCVLGHIVSRSSDCSPRVASELWAMPAQEDESSLVSERHTIANGDVAPAKNTKLFHQYMHTSQLYAAGTVQLLGCLKSLEGPFITDS